MEVYNSLYTGEQMDNALAVIINSEVTSIELSVLKDVTAGTASASKALVLDSNKSVEGVTSLSATSLLSDYLSSKILTVDPSGDAPVDRVYLYYKSDSFYVKKGSTVTKLAGGQKDVTDFTNQTVVNVNHGLGDMYPTVDIVVGNKKVLSDIEYVDEDNLTVTFGGLTTGKIICRTF